MAKKPSPKKAQRQPAAAAPRRAAASQAGTTPVVRHPIKAASLLYSAPPFVLRGPIYMMFVTMVSMLIYSIIATTDTLVQSPLKLQRQSVTVQAVGGGLVEAVDVGENSVVTAGAPLATIQERIRAAATPEQEALNEQIRDYQQRLETLRRDYNFRSDQLRSQITEIETRLATGKDQQRNRIAQLEIQLSSAERRRSNLESDISSAQSNVNRLRPLCDRRDIPRSQCDRAESRLRDLRRAFSNAVSDIENIRLSLDTARRQLEQEADRNTLARLENELTKAGEDFTEQREQIDTRIAELQARRLEAQTLVPGVRPGRTEEDRDKVYYYSTVDGVVTSVLIQRSQLVDPGAPIVTIVRNAAPLEARVLVQNRDIGQLKIGQDVQLKYFAYPYQEYGIQTGTIADISTRPSTRAGEQSLYVVKVALESETIRGPTGVDKPLEIGLEGIAEIKTGERRFIEVLFSPAAKFFRAEDSGDDPGDAGPDATTGL